MQMFAILDKAFCSPVGVEGHGESAEHGTSSSVFPLGTFQCMSYLLCQHRCLMLS